MNELTIEQMRSILAKAPEGALKYWIGTEMYISDTAGSNGFNSNGMPNLVSIETLRSAVEAHDSKKGYYAVDVAEAKRADEVQQYYAEFLNKPQMPGLDEQELQHEFEKLYGVVGSRLKNGNYSSWTHQMKWDAFKHGARVGFMKNPVVREVQIQTEVLE